MTNIRSKSITDKLVDNLHEQGIEVNLDYSEKEVKYHARTESRFKFHLFCLRIHSIQD